MQGRVLAVGRQLPRRIVVPSQGSPPSARVCGAEQLAAGCLQRPIRLQVGLKRARGHLAELATDRGDAAGPVGHEVLGGTQLLGRHHPWAPSPATAGAGAAIPSLIRWRMRFRSISANAASICRKARPAGGRPRRRSRHYCETVNPADQGCDDSLMRQRAGRARPARNRWLDRLGCARGRHRPRFGRPGPPVAARGGGPCARRP